MEAESVEFLSVQAGSSEACLTMVSSISIHSAENNSGVNSKKRGANPATELAVPPALSLTTADANLDKVLQISTQSESFKLSRKSLL